MHTLAVILEAPERMALRALEMKPVEASDVLVEIAFSGISTGTEKLLWTGRMPPFPGLGYPLVPGYESVGRIIDAGAEARGRIGDWVFVPGANCYTDARGLFGGTAKRVIVPSARALPIPEQLGESGVLCALAATALHAIKGGFARRDALPDLIIGHGVLGRLLARLTLAMGGKAPTVWEVNPARRTGAQGYDVIDPATDERRDYHAIYDVERRCFVRSIRSSADSQKAARLCWQASIPSLSASPSPRRSERSPAPRRRRMAARRSGLNPRADRMRTRWASSGLITNRRPAGEATDAYPEAFKTPTV